MVKALQERICKAQGQEHQLYEDMAIEGNSSFDFGVRMTMYALSQMLGEDKVTKAMQNWLKGVNNDGKV